MDDAARLDLDDGANRLRGLRILGACDNYTPDSSGGAEKAAHEIYMRWGRAGADVHVVSVPHGQPYADPGVTVETARGIDLSRLVGGYIALSPDSFRVAARACTQLQPHALHGNTIHYNACIAAARLAKRNNLPFILTAQLGPATEMPLMTRLAAATYERSVGRYVVRRATRVLAVSNTVREHMIRLGADPSRVHVVENGVDHERFAAPPLSPEQDPLILSIGRIVDNKGPQLLVEAAKLLAAQGRTIKVGFLGDGPLRERLALDVASAGLSDHVQFHGQVRDVESWMKKAAIVVRPSYTEGLPLAVLEAMSAGRCNVVSDISPNRELIQHDVNGLVFRTGDAADLAGQLSRAVSDEDLRVRLGAAAREASLSRSWTRMAAETAEVLIEECRKQGSWPS